MRNQASLGALQRLNDAFEGSGNICEVGDAASNDKNLAVWTGSWTYDQVD